MLDPTYNLSSAIITPTRDGCLPPNYFLDEHQRNSMLEKELGCFRSKDKIYRWQGLSKSVLKVQIDTFYRRFGRE